MASTQPAPLTLLRVKRARVHAALDAVHIRLSKRARTEAPDTRLFRRLPAVADIDTLGPARVVDIDPTILRKSQVSLEDVNTEGVGDSSVESGEGDTSPKESEILYNGVPLEREFMDDEYMYDIFAEDRSEHRAEGTHLDLLDGDNVAWVSGEDLPVFDWDSESEEEREESDDERSLDYPSTPEQSVSSEAFEEDWQERERRFCESDDDETEDGVERFYDIRGSESENDHDCADYDA